MKKYSFLSLILILALTWGFAAADMAENDGKITQPFSVNPKVLEKAERPTEAELIKQDMPQRIKDRLRLQEITADGDISADEVDEYISLRSRQKKPDFPPVVMNTVSETEPNNDCGSANAIAIGDTVQCAHLEWGVDDYDYFTFTLDTTYPSWLLEIVTWNGYECSETVPYDVMTSLHNSDCSVEIVPEQQWGHANIQVVIDPGTYVIRCRTNWDYNTGHYGLSLNAV